MQPARRRKYRLAGKVAALTAISSARRTVARFVTERKRVKARRRDEGGASSGKGSGRATNHAEKLRRGSI